MFTNSQGISFEIKEGMMILHGSAGKQLIIPFFYGGAPLNPDTWGIQKLNEDIEATGGVNFDYGLDAFGQTFQISFEHDGDPVKFTLAPPVGFVLLSKQEYLELYHEAITPDYLALQPGKERSLVPSVREADLFQLIQFSNEPAENKEIASQLIRLALEKNAISQ